MGIAGIRISPLTFPFHGKMKGKQTWQTFFVKSNWDMYVTGISPLAFPFHGKVNFGSSAPMSLDLFTWRLFLRNGKVMAGHDKATLLFHGKNGAPEQAVQALFKLCSSPVQALFKLYSSSVLALFMLCSSSVQALFKLYSKTYLVLFASS